MIRYLLLGATLMSMVWLPWPITIALMIVSSVWLPLSGIVFGALLEVVYAPLGTPGIPLGLLWGVAATIFGYTIARFISSYVLSA